MIATHLFLIREHDADLLHSLAIRFTANDNQSIVIETVPNIGTLWTLQRKVQGLVPDLRFFTIDTDDHDAVLNELARAANYPHVKFFIDLNIPITERLEQGLFDVVQTIPTILIRRI